MKVRTFKDKNNNEWSWNETPESIKAIEELHKSQCEVQHQMPITGSNNPVV